MKLRVLWVGKDRSGLFQPAADEYAGRLKHYCTYAGVELVPSKQSGEQAKTDEGERILSTLQPREALVALDVTGKSLGSVELAQWLAKQSQDLMFVIGGDEGLSAPVLQKASLTLSLSKLTFPHRLAKVMLLEQLYRAFTILKREPYHK